MRERIIIVICFLLGLGVSFDLATQLNNSWGVLDISWDIYLSALEDLRTEKFSVKRHMGVCPIVTPKFI